MKQHVAYFSMEVGLTAKIPTYSGGLGVLAGDTLKSMADLSVGVVAVTLLYRRGYFRQEVDASGNQLEHPVLWNVEDYLKPLSETVKVEIGGRSVAVRAWKFEIKGVTDHIVPVIFLDSDVAENQEADRHLTDNLYGGDETYRLSQEIILGCGGVKMLRALGYSEHLDTYHMNEGHAALLTLELLKGDLGQRPIVDATSDDLKKVKERCVFTTHTPVAAGHDRFSQSLCQDLLTKNECDFLQKHHLFDGEMMNMTYLALEFSRFTNGVAKRHGEVSQKMFPKKEVTAITNGIHAGTWTSPAVAKVFDEYIPAWRQDNSFFRYMCECPLELIDSAHAAAKTSLCQELKQLTGEDLDPNILTIGFARRAATYKRADLLFNNAEALKEIAQKYDGLQLVFAGKAHPKDEGGKKLIKNVVQAKKLLAGSNIKLVYVENYDMDLGAKITAGVDIWLNNPTKPMEASGTSGMKAALNGVPNLSTLDGWWVEGHVEGITGWEIPDAEDGMQTGSEEGTLNKETAQNLYDVLDTKVFPLYYKNPKAFSEIRRHSIALNGSFFNTHRMVDQYLRLAYSK